MKSLPLFFILWLVCLPIYAQKKSVPAHYISSQLNIDGVLDEPVYQLAHPAKDFVQLAPYNGILYYIDYNNLKQKTNG